MIYPKKIYLLPITIIIMYLVFSLILYAYGPFKWVTYHPFMFWTLNIAYIFSLYIGWNTALRTRTPVINKKWTSIDEERMARKLKFFIWINILFELLNAMRRFRFVSFDIVNLFYSITNGLTDVGLSYGNLQTEMAGVTGSILVGGFVFTLLNLLFSFLSFNIVILSGILFKQYNIYYKSVIAIMYLFIALEYISTGTNLGAFRIILIIVVIFAINYARTKKISQPNSKKRTLTFLIFSVMSVAIVLFIFNEIMQSRGGILRWQSSEFNIGGIGIDENSFLFAIMPSSFYMLIISFSGYICQGYYAMSLSLNLDWEPCFGLGHSKALQLLFKDYIKPIYYNTYQYRLNDFGWDENLHWHSLYSWFANDCTYIGVILVLFAIGFVFCLAYVDVLHYNNPYAKIVVYYFVFMCVFLPCNNQVFQSMYMFLGFIGSITSWILSRNGIRIKLSTVI